MSSELGNLRQFSGSSLSICKTCVKGYFHNTALFKTIPCDELYHHYMKVFNSHAELNFIEIN